MFIFIYLFTSVKLHFFSFGFMVSLTSDCWSTSLYGIMGKTDKYSAFYVSGSIRVPLLGKKEKDAGQSSGEA